MAVNKLAKDLTGMVIGDWTVIGRNLEKGTNHRYYNCVCVCGKKKVLRGSMLSQEKSKSCGCTTRTPFLGKHKQSNSPTYSTWLSMRYRCSKKDYDGYDRYGAKGITVCERWENSFNNFLEDMGERKRGVTIDRIDNSKGYFKENCRWATKKEQTLNRGVTKWLTYKGETLCLADMAKKYNMNSTMLLSRLNKGMTIEDAIEKPSMRMAYFFIIDGLTYSYSELCTKYGVSRSTIDNNRVNGKSFKDAVSQQLNKKGFYFDFDMYSKPYSNKGC